MRGRIPGETFYHPQNPIRKSTGACNPMSLATPPDASPSPELPHSPPANAPPQNPWKRTTASSSDPGAAPLGEPSAWPPLRSPSQIHLAAAAENASDVPEPSDSPPVSVPAIPAAADNYGAAARPSGPPPPPHHRRGRNQSQNYHHNNNNQRFHNYRGGNNSNGGGYRGGFGNRGRPPVPVWNPNLGFNPLWQPQPQLPMMHPFDVNPMPPFAFPVNHYEPQFYGGEAYVPYYGSPAFPLPPHVVPAGPAPRPIIPNFSGIGTWQNQVPSLLTQLREQIEYYFSEENLETDYYLRAQMDSCGWVDIPLIAKFKRVAALTKDLDMIKEALGPSETVELRGNKMRKKDGWDKYVQTSPTFNSLERGMQNLQLAG